MDWVATRHLANLGVGNALRVFGFLGGLQKNLADPLPTKISEKRDHALLDPITRSWPDHALFGFDHAFFFLDGGLSIQLFGTGVQNAETWCSQILTRSEPHPESNFFSDN